MESRTKCDWCAKRAVTSWREGRGTGHSETMSACVDHQELEYESVSRLLKARRGDSEEW